MMLINAYTLDLKTLVVYVYDMLILYSFKMILMRFKFEMSHR